MEAILELRNLKKSFGGIHAVQDVSFALEKGEILGLIGPNGSGKSTCVNLISGVYTKDDGEILFQGQEISKLSISARSHLGIGRTFQTPKPFTGLSVFDSVYTIAIQTRGYRQGRDDSMEVLEEMGLADLADTRCEKLPIEKRKWLDMSRILVTHPKVILLDEVMAGLNPMEIEANIKMIKKLNEKGISILFIEHVMKAVNSLCHRIVVLNEGQLLTSGSPEEVMNDDRVIRAYLGGGVADA